MSIRYDDLPALGLFAEVVRARSFSAAARKLGIAKSAVSKRIAQLEAQLGVLLLTRTTRKLALTSEGARFFEHCDALLREADLAAESVSGARGEARGIVRINAPVSFGQLHLARALAPFVRAHPEIAVSLSVDDRMVDVIEGGFDLVIRVTRLTEASSLVAKKLATSRLVVCGAPAYLSERGRPTHPSELIAHDCLHYELVPFSAEWRFRGPDGPFVVPSRKSFGSTNGTVLREAAIAGMGLAVLPSFIVARDVAEGRLELVLEGARRAQIGIYALFAHRKHLPLRTRLIVDHLGAYFRRVAWEAAS